VVPYIILAAVKSNIVDYDKCVDVFRKYRMYLRVRFNLIN